MIIWTGFGFVVPLIYFAIAIPMQLLFTAMGQAYGQNGFALASSFLLTGISLLLLDNFLVEKRTAKGQVYIDRVTGQEVVLAKTDTFFWLRLKWWGIVALVASAAFAAYGVMQLARSA